MSTHHARLKTSKQVEQFRGHLSSNNGTLPAELAFHVRRTVGKQGRLMSIEANEGFAKAFQRSFDRKWNVFWTLSPQRFGWEQRVATGNSYLLLLRFNSGGNFPALRIQISGVRIYKYHCWIGVSGWTNGWRTRAFYIRRSLKGLRKVFERIFERKWNVIWTPFWTFLEMD